VSDLDPRAVEAGVRWIQDRVAELIDRVKTSAEALPVVVVGGGSVLVRDTVAGASRVVKPDHFAVANAIGAAIAQVGGETDRVFSLAELPRERALEAARREAFDKALAAGADEASIQVVDVEEVPLAYLPSNAVRIRVKASATSAWGCPMRLVREADLDDLATGAAVLGTGGGGNPYIGKLLAQQAIRAEGPVALVSADEVPDDALVVQSAMMGAPTVMVEKLPAGDEIVRAFETIQAYLGRRITHTTSGEAGGLNSTIPFVVAARMGIPLIDADGMGRAFPELQMLIPSMEGIPCTPMALADEKGNTLILDTIDNHWTERLARSATVDMGCTAMIALYPMSGRQVRETMVLGTLSLGQELGRLIREARAAHRDPVDVVAGRLGGRRIFDGRVTDVRRRTEAGFARGMAQLDGLGACTGSRLTVQFQNEHLVAIRDGVVLASVPDLIIMLDTETAEPVTTEEVRYGFRVTVVTAPCDPRWHTAKGLELVGPRYFGYDFDYAGFGA